MSEGRLQREGGERERGLLRLFCAQALVIGGAASAWSFVADGTGPRAVGFLAMACAAGVALLLGRR